MLQPPMAPSGNSLGTVPVGRLPRLIHQLVRFWFMLMFWQDEAMGLTESIPREGTEAPMNLVGTALHGQPQFWAVETVTCMASILGTVEMTVNYVFTAQASINRFMSIVFN